MVESRFPERCNHRELIHDLHQRYHREWERAERLERELARVRGSWFGKVWAWGLYLKRCLRPGRPTPPSGCPARPELMLQEDSGPLAGRVSIIVPFKDRLELVLGLLRSFRHSSYRDFEVVLVD